MNKDKRLASFLTTLLCGCLVAEAGLGTYVGLKMFMAKQEQEFQAARYEAYLEEQEQRRENPPKIQYAGPTMRVVDGVLMDWDDHIIPDPVPVEAGSSAPAVSVPKSNLEENTTEPETAPTVQQTSKPVDSAGSNSSNSKADSSGSTSGNQSSGTAKPTSENNNSSSGNTAANSTQTASEERKIYITPTGKKYHYNNNCNGGTYNESTLEKALSLGLEPCNKCVNK